MVDGETSASTDDDPRVRSDRPAEGRTDTAAAPPLSTRPWLRAYPASAEVKLIQQHGCADAHRLMDAIRGVAVSRAPP